MRVFGGFRVGLLLAAVCAGAALPATGCGDGEDSTASNKPKLAVASEPPEPFVQKMAKVLETASNNKECKEIYQLNGSSVTRLPCPAPKDFRKSMASFKLVGAETFGPAAVVDYTSGAVKDNATIVLFAAPTRDWGIGSFGVLSPRSVGTDDAANRAAYRAAADAYIEAVRTRDCKEFMRTAFTKEKSEQKVCSGQFKETAPFGKRLQKAPDAKLKYEGGNGSYGFFTVATPKPEPASTTVAVASAGEKQGKPAFLVLEWAPGPTREELQRVARQFREQQRQEREGDTSTEPTQKPLTDGS